MRSPQARPPGDMVPAFAWSSVWMLSRLRLCSTMPPYDMSHKRHAPCHLLGISLGSCGSSWTEGSPGECCRGCCAHGRPAGNRARSARAARQVPRAAAGRQGSGLGRCKRCQSMKAHMVSRWCITCTAPHATRCAAWFGCRVAGGDAHELRAHLELIMLRGHGTRWRRVCPRRSGA